VTEDNYFKALDRLKERYDKSVLIFLDCITNLLNLPAIVRVGVKLGHQMPRQSSYKWYFEHLKAN